MIAAKASDLNPPAGGTVRFDTDPVALTATITFDQVREWSSPGTNTFQYRFDAAGNVELRFGNCAASVGLTGWSPGIANLDPGGVDISAAAVITPAPRDRVPLTLAASARPVLGTTIQLTLSQVPAGSAFAAHVLGLSEGNPALNLAGFGMPDCFQYFSQDAVRLTVGPSSTVQYALSLPNNIGFAGVVLGVQGAVLDPAGGHNALGALSSNGVALTVNRL